MSDDIQSFLTIHPISHGLSANDIDAVAQCGILFEAGTGDYLQRSGEKVQSVFLVLSGRLALTVDTPSGPEQELFTLGRGSQFGILSLAMDEVSPVNLRVEETAQLIRIAAADCEQLSQNIPLLRRNFLRSIGRTVGDKFLTKKSRADVSGAACIVFDEESRELLRRVSGRLAEFGESIGVLTDKPRGFDDRIDVVPLLNEKGERISDSDVRAVISGWHGVDRVFLEVADWPDDATLQKLISRVGEVWWICSSHSCDRAIARMEQVSTKNSSWKQKSLMIWMLNPDEQVVPYRPQLSALFHRDFKIWLDAREKLSFTQRHSFERLIHFVRGVQIGLALGGGAARGMAHLGVLQSLECAGIVVDQISGTSAGALTSLTYCSGYSPEYAIEQFTADLQPDWIYSTVPKGSSWYLLAKYRKNSWDKMLRKYLFDWRLEQCPIPGCSVAADLVQAEQVVRRGGDIVDAILETINLPILSSPICRDGMALIDGSILNVLPADVLVDQGCNFVIGVNVSSKINHEFAGNTSQTPTGEMTTPGIMPTLLRTLNVLDRNMSAVGASAADFTIEPDVAEVDVTAFYDTPKIAERGRLATDRMVGRLKKILNRIDGKLFA